MRGADVQHGIEDIHDAADAQAGANPGGGKSMVAVPAVTEKVNGLNGSVVLYTLGFLTQALPLHGR
ncbi:MAG TPA: hypothetical protein VLK84_29975 [Longimicrobium sp.]|nr:hypothetical protein [Longimicrobium sp.]